ncbi:DPP6 N-terminal domain-like protein [Tanacetum coccineum]|uniref:DPP6 N-terminal domain-like protein n=1 Tax=Tanacetum coccineum TaxID=301880 RepID=A0ABQ5AQB2_9ASTR
MTIHNLIITITQSLATDTSIIFTTNGRSRYAFDIFSLPLNTTTITIPNELHLTDGHSVNFNGYFVTPSGDQTLTTLTDPLQTHLVYVTERDGSSSIFLDTLSYGSFDHARKILLQTESARFTESTRAELTRSQRRLVGGDGKVSMKDRPSLVNGFLVYVSTREDPGVGRTSLAAVYSTELSTGLTSRLSPEGVADFSPAVSPSGLWTAVASFGEKRWGGEVEELSTDIYVFRTEDRSGRVKVVEHAGWSSWGDEGRIYFHRRGEDGWWSVYVAILPGSGRVSVDSVVTRRGTPPGLHAFTPAASVADKSIIAVATRRPGSDYRHIEIYDVVSGGSEKDGKRTENDLFLENIKIRKEGISLFRIDGSFPSFSPDGDRIAYVGLPGLYVVNSDGSGQREILSDITAFSTAWNPKRKGVIYTSIRPTFTSVDTGVDIVEVNLDADQVSFRKLTVGGQNNAFPAVSPGRGLIQCVTGLLMGNGSHSHQTVITRVQEVWTGLRQLIHSGSAGRTNHPWFSPDGKYIVFTSDYAALTRLTHNSYEDGTSSWGPKYMTPKNVEWSTGEEKCSFEVSQWLAITDNDYAKIQCGGGDENLSHGVVMAIDIDNGRGWFDFDVRYCLDDVSFCVSGVIIGLVRSEGGLGSDRNKVET